MKTITSDTDLLSIDKYKGELDGNYTTLWVATDKNLNHFVTHNLELKQTSDLIQNDHSITKWQNISAETFKKYSEELHHAGVWYPESNSTNNLTKTTMEKEKKETSITGYVGKDPQYKYFEESKKSTLAFTIKEPGADGQWVHIRAFNTNAEKLNAAFKEGIDKVTVQGNTWQDVSYQNKKGEQVEYKELLVNDVIKHKVIEISGNIGKIENKETSKGKAFTEILVINEQVTAEGKAEKHLYNVTLWADKQKGVPSHVKLEKGAPLAVKGEANILTSKDSSKEYITIQAWNLDVSKEKLQSQIADKMKNAASKEAAVPKTTSKGQGQSM